MSYTPFDAIQIGIASPEMILSWSYARVPHGKEDGETSSRAFRKALNQPQRPPGEQDVEYDTYIFY